MTNTAEKVVSQVSNRKEAEQVVVKLLQDFCSEVAYRRMTSTARASKQSVNEEAKRLVSNLFRSLK